MSLSVVQILGLKAYAALLWLPILVLCVRYVTPMAAFMTASVVPPLRVETSTAKGSNSYKNTLRLLIAFWCALVLMAVTQGFLTGWLAYLLSGSREEAATATDLWSMPLGLINREFFITPEKGLTEVLGIIMANSYFNALGLIIIFKIVHGFIKRSRVTQLGISGTTLTDDDEL